MGLPPRRASCGRAPPAPAPAPTRPPLAAGDDTDDDFDELYSEVAAAAAPAPGWAVGDKVEAKFCVDLGARSRLYSRDFYPATVAAVHGDGTVDVDYDTSDEETEERLPVRHVRKRRRAPAAPPPTAASPKRKKHRKKAPSKCQPGAGSERSRLLALCMRRGIPCLGNGTVSTASLRQKLAAFTGLEPGDDDLGAGTYCFCRWENLWYGGKIVSVDGDSYRVHFLGFGKQHDGDYAAEDVRPAR